MITVYGLSNNLATNALTKWLKDNQIQFKYIEITDEMKFIHVVPLTSIMKDNASYVLHGYDADTVNKILDILQRNNK